MLGGWGQPEIVKKAKMGEMWQGRNVNHLWVSWDLKMKVVGPKSCGIMEK